MNAREFWFVVKHLALLLPSTENEDQRQVYNFALLMGKLLQACLLKTFSEQDLQDLAEMITKHNQKYMEIFEENFNFVCYITRK